MRNILLLVAVCCLLSSCGFGNFVDKCVNGPPPNPPREPLRDTKTGKAIKIWVPKNMLRTSSWEFQARGEEARCSNGHYWDKEDWELFPSQRSIYKILPNGDKIWAYYYYYGEDMPGFDSTKWYITVFNIYAHPDGEIYACYWAKFPSEYRLEHGTSDGIRP